MTQRRPLSDEEKAISQKQLENLAFEIKDLEFQQKYNELMLESGLEVGYLKKKLELNQTLKTTKQQLEHDRRKIDALKDQLKNGVVIKNKESEE